MCLMIRIISKDVDEIRNTTIGVGDTNPQTPHPLPPSSFTLLHPECEILSSCNIHFGMNFATIVADYFVHV